MSDISEPMTSPDLKALQRILTMIASDIDVFCREHGIVYYLMGGTALGAMRHGGFIPWDDDFDIFMDRANYKKFLAACESSLDTDKYYLQREDTAEWPLFFSKIRLNETLYVERTEDVDRMHSGLYIDVMCLHNVFSNTFMRRLQFYCARVLSAIALSHRGYETTSGVKKMALTVAHALGRPPVKRLLLRFVRSLDGTKTDMVGHFFGRAPFHKTSFPRSLLGEPRRVPFEDIELPVAHDVEGYLKARFGPRYMEMPDQKTLDAYPSHLLSYDLGPYK